MSSTIPSTFPIDAYTPFGYLANPAHRATSWTACTGGLLRSDDGVLGFGWVEPTARRSTLAAGLAVALRWRDRTYQSRADFTRLGYHSQLHSATRFSFDWQLDGLAVRLTFALAETNALAAELQLTGPVGLTQECELLLVGQVWGQGAHWRVERQDHGWRLLDRASGRVFAVALVGADGATTGTPIGPDEVRALAPRLVADDRRAAGWRLSLRVAPGDRRVFGAALARDAAAPTVRATAAVAAAVVAERQASDDAFYAAAALPVGDWPSEWRRGWIYDLETTRACIYPAGGIFRDAWLSWMLPWPRVVVAEGTLDAVRYSYAAPAAALALVQTLFRDAPSANVPCVFAGGEPNMVAKDGTVCGTSPAWCLPFHNLWLLWCRTGDRAWLAELFPRLEAYLDYWLRERTDEAGWVVYRCTWEAGEDCSPRLDPAGEGDAVISRFVRPVELQATTSQSAAILARFARVLGDVPGAARWRAVAEDYAARTRTLWDPATGRYRDWDKRTEGFLTGQEGTAYWQTDPVRFSALSLTPLVAGIAGPAERDALAAEIRHFDAAPWCLWPSWSYVVAEAATAAGWYDFAGAFAARIVQRVYRAADRRSLDAAARPTPGTAPEFWPLDLADFDGSDGYGWGATTTSLWVRQIFGFLDGDDPSRASFTLAPALPADLLIPGRTYGFTHLPCPGHRLEVSYAVTADGLEASVVADPPAHITAAGPDGAPRPFRSGARPGETRFAIPLREATQVAIAPVE